MQSVSSMKFYENFRLKEKKKTQQKTEIRGQNKKVSIASFDLYNIYLMYFFHVGVNDQYFCKPGTDCKTFRWWECLCRNTILWEMHQLPLRYFNSYNCPIATQDW